MKKITLAVLCLFLTAEIFANHHSTAEVRYEYSGIGNVYRIYVTTVTPCPGVNSPGESVQINSSCTSFSRGLPRIAADTFLAYCGTASSCSGSSVWPRFMRQIYSDTVTLAPCIDWKISFIHSLRDYGVNLGGSGWLYVESFLNNSVTHNSSPYMATAPFHSITSNVLTTIPLQSIDPENDSLVYEWYQPLGGVSSPIPYASPYSLTNPVNGTATLNTVSQTMQLQAPSVGKYTLALRVKDYRNGQLLGITCRDFLVNALAGTTASNPPIAAANSVMSYTTCPGQSNNISLAFNDQPTDSVYLKVRTPTIPGFTFTKTISQGLGSASANISWTTPTSFNPATLPFFYINFETRDNQCPGANYANYAVMVLTKQCTNDSVWAGDANGDWTVNAYDPLAVAVAFGKIGVPRPNASTNWQAQFCPDWVDTFMNGVNMKHADCNGDGIVDINDLAAINTNYGSFHFKGGPKAKTTAVPDLYFDITGISFYPGANVSIPIKLGSSTDVMNNMYGIGTTISIGGITPVGAPSISYPASWLGNSSNTISFIKALGGNQNITWAYARKDHQQVNNGQGTIAHLDFTIPSSAPIGQKVDLMFNNSLIIDRNMSSISGFNELDTAFYIQPLSVNNIHGNINYAHVVPNPSQNLASLQIGLMQNQLLAISVTDMIGKTVWKESVNGATGGNILPLPASIISSGIYLIKISDQNNSLQTIKWIKK